MHLTSRLGVLAVLAAASLIACSGSDSETTPAGDDTGTSVTDSGSGDDSSTTTDTGSGTDSASDDSSIVDSGTPTDGSGDDGGGEAGFDCTGKTDGTDCGGGSICLGGLCKGSSCGDGFINAAAGEDCEDGNTVDGDGCTSCKFDCKADTECDDTNDCTTDTCDKSAAGKQLCKFVNKADASACTLTGGGSGTCKAGVCQKAGCGNGTKEGTEECDDGNTDNTDGCKTDCTFTCKADADCDDTNKCNGTETCNTTTHKCVAGTAVTCPVKGSCTAAGTCDMTSGACAYADADKDGKTCDVDCNDADPAIFPGAPECKDTKDNDCNPATPDAVDCLCYADSDRDGYAISGAASVTLVTCGMGYTNRKPDVAANQDCREGNASVNPGQTSWFTSSYCAAKLCIIGGAGWSYDYNCDGTATQQFTHISTGVCTSMTTQKACIFNSGWTTATVPACGATGGWRQCGWNTLTGKCTGSESTRTQACH